MNGSEKFFWLVGQIFPVAFGGITLGVLSYLIDPWLLLFLFKSSHNSSLVRILLWCRKSQFPRELANRGSYIACFVAATDCVCND